MIKNKKLWIGIFAVLVLVTCITLLYSCNNNDEVGNSNPDIDIDTVDKSFDDSDINSSYNENEAISITFSGESVNIDGIGADATGTDVIISSKGTYIISGNTEDGSITVDVGKGNEAHIVLSGLELTNSDGPAVYVKSGKKITITLAEGTVNVISDGNNYEIIEDDSTLDASIFSKSDLVFNGTGYLTVNGNNAHGIVSKDELLITGGNITVKSAGAGLCGKDSLKITGADIKVDAGSDALRSDNETDDGLGFIYIKDGSFDLTAVNDGIQAYSIVSIEGGTFNIKTTSSSYSESAKGIKGGTGVSITGGNITVDSEDDSVHSDGDVSISGGKLVLASGDDGIHANDVLQISDGSIIITNSYEGIEGTHIVISGGYVDITSSDDGMNASGGNDSNASVTGRPGMDMFEATDGSITVSGGYVIMHNEGDGIDSNGSVEVSGGVILVDGPQSGGNGSFDYASSAKITGGVVITLGTSDMAQNFTEATQGSMLVTFNGYGPAGTVLSVVDEDGNVIVAFTSTKYFNCALFTAPEIKKGGTYSIYMDADIEGLDDNGYAHNTVQTGGTELGSITMTDYIYGQGSGMGGGTPGGGGGRPGGRPW